MLLVQLNKGLWVDLSDIEKYSKGRASDGSPYHVHSDVLHQP